MSFSRSVASAVLVCVLFAGTLHSQSVRLTTPIPDDSAALVLREIISRNQYTVLDRDTTLQSDALLAGDLIVLAARVNLEGRITGAVAVLDGELFVRPGAVVEGAIAVAGRAGAYPSGLARTGPLAMLSPRYTLFIDRSRPDSLGVAILQPPRPFPLRLSGIFGFGLPSYERVNGLSVPWGANARFGDGDTATVEIEGTATYRAARQDFDGQMRLTYRPSVRSEVHLTAGRTTQTMDDWIRGDLANTLSSIGLGSDVRDYFESDEVSLTLLRLPPGPLVEGEHYLVPRLTARYSRDRALSNAEPWSVFETDDEGWRENPAIDEGELASVVAGATAAWRGISANFSGQLAVEWAPGSVGDFEFAQLSSRAAWGMEALWRHRISLDGYLLVPFGKGEAPLQRWSSVGGPGTLPTEDEARMRGDHLVFLRTIYVLPIRGAVVPLLGQAWLRFEHDIGGAWRSGDARPQFEQNLGLGLELSVLKATVYTNPAKRPREYQLSVGVALPGSTELPIF